MYVILLIWHFFFFFQAEDGIRDLIVTGVQTCALPISYAQIAGGALRSALVRDERERRIQRLTVLNDLAWQLAGVHEPFDIAQLAYDAAGKLVARDSFYVARYDGDKREFEFLLQADGGEVWRGERYPLGNGPTSQVVLA